MFESGKIEKYAALIFGLAFLIYALFPMQTFYWDGIIYARFIEDTVSARICFTLIIFFTTFSATRLITRCEFSSRMCGRCSSCNM